MASKSTGQTPIATAFVHIVPEAEGIKGKLSGVLETGATEAGTSAGGKFAKALGIAAGAATAALGVAAAGLGAITKSALDGVAELEQNVGGVETLFGSASQTVIDNANNAYKSAGVSANEYMQQVTSFSASLLQSLGGDTQAAAEYANRAVVDMADNANKMGTDMASIQNAYQGFAKQNYTMLDNLKLGYGGTQAEMQRLIQDAAAMTDVQNELGVSVDASSMSFGNIVNAISVMQKSMGIAGTTSLEAASTITGSVASLSAAWDNFLSGAGDASALSEAFATAASQIVTNLSEIIPRLAEGLPKVITAITDTIPDLVSGLLPSFVSGVSTLVSGVISALPSIFSAFSAVIPQVITAITDSLPLLAQAAVTIITTLCTGLGTQLPTLIPAIVDAVILMVDTLVQNAPMMVNAALQLIVGLRTGLMQALPTLLEYLPELINGLTAAIIDSIPYFVEAGFQLFVALVQNMPAILTSLVTAVIGLLKNIVGSMMGQLPSMTDVGQRLMDAVKNGIINAKNALINSAKQIIESIKSALGGVASKFLSIGTDIVRGIWNGISSSLGWIKSKIKSWVGNVLSFIKNLFGIGSPSKVMRDEVGRWIPAGMAIGIEKNSGVVTGAMDQLMTDANTAAGTIMAGIPSAKLGTAYGEASNNTVTLNVYGQNGQDVNALANVVMDKLNRQINRKGAVYA